MYRQFTALAIEINKIKIYKICLSPKFAFDSWIHATVQWTVEIGRKIMRIAK